MRLYHLSIAAEMLEHDISKRLWKFRKVTPFQRYGRNTVTGEVFQCCYRTAKRHFENEINGSAVHYSNIELQCLQ